jgi:16S rRNA (adenine1518-N6/adenine1519-N6)-dimethyltransferase
MSADPTPQPQRQTQSYLRNLFREHGLSPKTKLGQNFLIDLNLIDFVVRNAELDRADFVLEVGTGTGGLTSRLAEHAGSVVTVEVDPSFADFAKTAVGPIPHVTFFQGDVLKGKNYLNPMLLETIAKVRDQFQPQRLKLVANLPYSVATPVISNLLMGDLPWERMVVTVQWEIAEKLIAAPGHKEYGALAILVQSLADVEVLRRLPPTVFWPKPKVESGIVRLWPRAPKRAAIPDVQRFRVFLRDLYAHRRKNLRGSLVSMPASDHDKGRIDALLARLGLDGTTRAETLSREDHLRLCEALHVSGSPSG